ncbi:MAG: aminoacyl-tRNA hydrolase [Leptospiraceae bacterium]|nr:aminoacyl-tRNA hydrolase [Leptospiraceae bacterium]
MSENKFLIVGLGNPGSRYTETRHNIGFKVIEAFVDKHNGSFSSDKKCSSGKIVESVRNVYYLKPLEYMNLSGKCVSSLSNLYKIDIDNILVIHDEIDFPFGKLKMKIGGGAAGHNGLKDIIDKMGKKEFHRLRFGVGRPTNPAIDVADYVLGKFSEEERNDLPKLIQNCIEKIEEWLKK